MKRFILATIVPLLLFVVIFNSSCAPSSSVVSCLGDIGVKVVASIITDDAPLTVVSLLSVVPECVNAAIDVFASAPSSNPSSPEAAIAESPIDGVSAGSVNSNTWPNCGNYPQSVEFSFSVPFQMVVGPEGSQDTFDKSPNGSSDNELVAQQLFQQYGGLITSKTTKGASQSLPQLVPAHTQVTLTLPIQLSYKEGDARVIHTDGSTTTLPWLFTDGYHQAGPITFTYMNC